MKKEKNDLNKSTNIDLENIEEIKNENKDNNISNINSELRQNIEKMRKKNLSPFKKRLKIIKTSYLLTYKSLSQKKILYFWLGIILAILFLFLSLKTLSDKYLINIPTYGGEWNEGVIGVPRNINPVLAKGDVELDIVKLVFSGLTRKNKNMDIVNDLAENIKESEDGLSYEIRLKNNIKFSDNIEITTDDIIFTISKIQDKNINSPLSIYFEGVTLEKIDNKNIVFHLKKPYFYFNEILTFGILPKHILGELVAEEFLLSEFNLNPIGSGPYKIKNIKKENNIAKEYIFEVNKNYSNGKPFIDNLNLFIYQNNENLLNAINSGLLDGTGYLDNTYFSKIENKNYNILKKDLPNIYMLSFNINKNTFLASKENRLFLNNLINKDDLINNVLGNYYSKEDVFLPADRNKYYINTENKKDIIKNTEINISTIDTNETKKVAEKIKEYFENNGIITNINLYSINDLNDIIKNRNFEILLYGSIIEKDIGLYSFWHSSQRTAPGMNITNYVSKKLDENLILLKDEVNKEKRKQLLINIEEELLKEMPAIPLYSSNFNYIIKTKNILNEIENKIPEKLDNKSERFININEWYKKEESVWSFSYNKKLIEKLSNIIK